MNVEEARVRLVNAERLIRKTIALCFNTNSTIFKMDMLETLRDPIWQSLIALIAIAVSIYFFVLQRKKKSLSYTVLTETALLTINEAIKSKLQIIYEGRPVQEVHLVVLRVVNDGNISIDVKDFYEPLRFKFGDDANILSAETIDATKTLRPQLSIIENSVKVEPILLNDKDTFKIKILVAQYTKRVEADARIFGVRKTTSRVQPGCTIHCDSASVSSPNGETR